MAGASLQRANCLAGFLSIVVASSLTLAMGCDGETNNNKPPPTGSEAGSGEGPTENGGSGSVVPAPSGGTSAGEPGGGTGATGAGATAGAPDNGGGVGAGGEPGGGVDTVPPTIVSVEPADGEAGVEADAVIAITFSEPMAKATTQAAYQSASAGIAPGSVTFSWNPAGTVLTINPNAAFVYAQGTDPEDVVATGYSYFISSAAEDRAGNALTEDYPVAFSTLRRITQRLEAPAGALNGGYVVMSNYEGATSYLEAGCLEANEIYRSFVTFDLQDLPAGIVLFESASLQMYQDNQSSIDRTPYAALGALEAHAMTFSSINRATFDALDAQGLLPIAEFGMSAADGYKSVLVTTALTADYDARDKSQFGIKFHTSLNTDGHHDFVTFDEAGKANPPVLETTYLVP